MRGDDDTVPTQPQSYNAEVIHPRFDIIDNIFDGYKSCILKDDKECDAYKYSCTPSAITDKLHLCIIDFDGVEGIDPVNPVHVKLCQQVSDLMFDVYRYLEKLILNTNDSKNLTMRLHRLAVRLLTLLQKTPSITAATISKLVICCLIDSTNLYWVDEPSVSRESIINLINKVDNVCLGMSGGDSRNDPKCLLNFQYLYDVVKSDRTFKDAFISDPVTENMELLTNPDDMVHAESVKSASVDTYNSSMNSLAEMFQVMSDGTIKVSISEKTTYMNEYAMNHRLLKYNHQQRDYESMKYNIVYHMILIDAIEKNVLYNKKVDKKSELYKDAEQARRMAKSDIAQYLPEIRRNSPDFNLNEMYKRVKADKATITIQGAETASGIKTIIKHILY
jgi:hypothetical protein